MSASEITSPVRYQCPEANNFFSGRKGMVTIISSVVGVFVDLHHGMARLASSLLLVQFQGKSENDEIIHPTISRRSFDSISTIIRISKLSGSLKWTP